MASAATQTDLAIMIAEQVMSGIDEAVGYWLGRIEHELVSSKLIPSEQLKAIERVLQEYKEVTGKMPIQCAQA